MKEKTNSTQEKPKFSFKKKLINALLVLVACIFAILALIIISGRVQNKVPFIFGKATLWVLSDSMQDTIPAHSYVLIEKVDNPQNDIEVGDIITFYSSAQEIKGELNTHQVVEIDRENGWFITRGTNSPANDSAPVPYDSVVGRYVRNLPALTAIGRFYSTSTGFIVTTIILLVVIGAIFAPDIIKSFKKSPTQSAEIDEQEKQREIERLIALEVERLKQQNAQISELDNPQSGDTSCNEASNSDNEN